MFPKRRITPHVYNAIEKGNLDLSFSSFYVPTPVDEFQFEVVDNPFSSESVSLTSDVSILFNQNRLDRCSKDSLIQYFDSISRLSSPLSALRSKLSDDQLISIIKSRYIQSPSELLAYSNFIVSEYGSELASLAGSNPAGSNPAGSGPAGSVPACSEPTGSAV
nr:hypothetical protein JLTIEETK_JLTIEETK_CDS_0008 [Microvirus sp.]